MGRMHRVNRCSPALESASQSVTACHASLWPEDNAWYYFDFLDQMARSNKLKTVEGLAQGFPRNSGWEGGGNWRLPDTVTQWLEPENNWIWRARVSSEFHCRDWLKTTWVSFRRSYAGWMLSDVQWNGHLNSRAEFQAGSHPNTPSESYSFS